MVQLDTSFVAPLVIAEATSDVVEVAVRKLPAGELTTSLWTQVELASLVSRKIRMGKLSDAEAEAVRREFERVLRETFDALVPRGPDFVEAGKYLAMPRTGLRAGTHSIWRSRRITAPGRSCRWTEGSSTRAGDSSCRSAAGSEPDCVPRSHDRLDDGFDALPLDDLERLCRGSTRVLARCGGFPLLHRGNQSIGRHRMSQLWTITPQAASLKLTGMPALAHSPTR